MKLGLSSYSFAPAMADGRLSLSEVVRWAADHGADHVEIAEAGLPEPLTVHSAQELAEASASLGIPLVNYVVAADFRGSDFDAELRRVKEQVDIAAALGASFFRHDLVQWAWRESSQAELEEFLPTAVRACQEISDYAESLGGRSSVENHGFFMNHSERLARLIEAVDRPGFQVTLDVGNFLCVDDSPLAAVQKLAPYASVVHLKDFYIRSAEPGPGWLRTVAGNYIQGSVVGFGDLPLDRVLRSIHGSSFDGHFSIEYEGTQDCLAACETALGTARELLTAAGY